MDLRERATAVLSLLELGGRVLARSEVYRDLHPARLPRLLPQLLLGPLGPLSLWRIHALGSPEREALVTEDVRLTFGELDQRTNRLSRGLQELGVGPGDRVGLMVENGHEFIETSAALSYLSATAVQIGYRLKAGEVAHILRHSGAKAVVFHAAFADVVLAAVAEVGGGVRCVASAPAGDPPVPGCLSYAALTERGDGAAPPRVAGGGFGGQMLYTSGTTGKSKGARRDLRQTSLASVIALLGTLPLYRDDRHLTVCPLYHLAAASFCQFVLGVGGCLVIPRHFDAAKVPGLIAAERVTSTVMVPTMFTRLLSLPPAALLPARGHLRWVMSVAAPLPTELARRTEAALGPVLFNLYGATETGLVTLAGPGEHTARPGTIGRAILGNEILLLDEAGREVGVGAVGEIYVRNGTLMSGYHDDPAATAAATRRGFVSVGDVGYRDADGYYYISDRKTDMVISAGVNIYPLEIEERLHAHAQVADCAVVGVPDAEWGESLVAFVVLRPEHAGAAGPALAEELRAFVGERLAGYKRPRRVEFLAHLPRNPTGKVMKRELRQRAAATG